MAKIYLEKKKLIIERVSYASLGWGFTINRNKEKSVAYSLNWLETRKPKDIVMLWQFEPWIFKKCVPLGLSDPQMFNEEQHLEYNITYERGEILTPVNGHLSVGWIFDARLALWKTEQKRLSVIWGDLTDDI